MADSSSNGGSVADALPVDRLKQVAQTLVKAATDRAVSAAMDQVDNLTGKLTDAASNGGQGLFGGGGDDDEDGDDSGGGFGGAIKRGASAVKDSVTGALGNVIPGMGNDDDEGDEDGDGDGEGEESGGSSGSGRGKFKFMNITEQIDVGVPVRVAYDAWTQFGEFSGFMKKVESVNQEDDAKQTWKAQVFLSHRTWEATIREQVPDSHIIWVSEGAKGHADGCVSFHELAPNMTRIILVMEYYPQGFFEKTANLWRAVGRRARLEFKHFARHVTMDTLINRDELEGWRGEIRDSEVVKTHEEAMEEEQAAAEGEQDSDEDLADDEYGEDDEEFAAEDDPEFAEDDEADPDAAEDDEEFAAEDDEADEEPDDAEDAEEPDAAEAEEPEEPEEEERPARRSRRQRVSA